MFVFEESHKSLAMYLFCEPEPLNVRDHHIDTTIVIMNLKLSVFRFIIKIRLCSSAQEMSRKLLIHGTLKIGSKLTTPRMTRLDPS